MDRILHMTDGTPLTVTRKAVKRITLRIDPADCSLRVSAPLRCPDSDILRFVNSKAVWIARHKTLLANRPEASTSSDQVFLWGRSLTVRRCDGTGPVTVSGDLLLVPVLPSAADAAVTAKTERFLAAQLQQALPIAIRKGEAALGVHATAWQIRTMSSRWGSCTPATGAIRLNYRLVHYPPICLQMIIIHELCHLLEKGHNARFYSFMDQAMPDWRRADQLLKGVLKPE